MAEGTASKSADTTPTTDPSPNTITIRHPSSHTLPSAKAVSSTVKPPSAEWLQGTWQVTHSTLPMWKGKCNVRITYTALPSSHAMPDIDDLVQYQNNPGAKTSSVHGISRVADVQGLERGLAYSWRGRGWLVIASSKWEILGWGEENGVGWVVTYFSKTLFTPAGIDVYCRDPKGLSGEAMAKIGEAFKGMEEPSIKKLGEALFGIPPGDAATNGK